MKASDLPAVSTLNLKKPKPISHEEIDRINDLYAGMRRGARQLLKDAMEIGDWFTDIRENVPRDQSWVKWLRENFPKIGVTTIWRFQKLAAHREFLSTMMRGDALLSPNEALQLISQQKRMAKPRVRAVVVGADAAPEVLLEAKLKNYVISLYLLRYLEVEIKGMLESMDLKPDQLLKILHYVCKEHHEVEEEVLRVFKPGLKVLPKGA